MLHTTRQAAEWLKSRVTSGLHSDSRKVQAGGGFIAWPGAVNDARAHVPAALQAGASACLVEAEGAAAFRLPDEGVEQFSGLKAATGPIAAAYFEHPSKELAVLAVTGTNGKTSTAWWLAQSLSALQGAAAMPAAVIGTLGMGCPPAPGAAQTDAADTADAADTPHPVTRLQATGLTTPDPVQLQQALRRFANDGIQACAIEATSIGIEEGRLNGTEVRLALFTNFTQDHLDYHGSMEAYWQAKRRLFGWSGLQGVVLNIDDARGLELAETLDADSLDVWTFASTRPARLRARNIAYSASGMCFEVVEQGQHTLPLQTGLMGSYNVSNLLCVLAALRALDVPLAEAVRVGALLQPVPGRMECLGGAGQPLVAVDYAHTPDALGQALQALRPTVQARAGRLWCVFGCGGDRDRAKRPLMGAMATRHADRVVVTSDNPRSEKPESIIAQILLGMACCNTLEVESDRARAIAQTIARAAAADVVLLAGKGHEATQEIAGVKTPFSDRAHVLQALRQRQANADQA
ncbi:MAG: UDP-N-acetylmuramoyl-L-alanyl-D-glutamate--2,6-diaminopimelate ligase [Rhodoferax sp.]|nr:UDP-N-acetylmuramoyl-L-alanyl-D-glutamate--2,6-diaminopimelate ligase [Rhodoferax sp.]